MVDTDDDYCITYADLFELLLYSIGLLANERIDCFDFEIVSGDASSANHQLTLTNKNRVQFSMTMLAEDYDSKPFLAFVAVKYNSSWHVSDNFVSNLIDTEPK